jgi:hypothetical protein
MSCAFARASASTSCRSSGDSPLATAAAATPARGTVPAITPIALTAPASLTPQASASGVHAETPATLNVSIPRWAMSAATSLAQSRIVLSGVNVDRPKPGRSGKTMRAPTADAVSHPGCTTPVAGWHRAITWPSLAPHST